MRRASLAVALGLTVALLAAGCGKAEPEAPPAAVPGKASAPVTGDEGAPPDAREVPPRTPAEAPSDVDAREAVAIADTAPVAEAVPVEGDAEEATPTPLAELPTVVDRAACEQVCAHALAIALAELPDGASEETREALEDGMRDECPKTCVERASVESIRCIMKATTMLGLGNCPD